MINARFNEVAYLSKAIITSDGEQSRGELKKKSFRCCETELKQNNFYSPMPKVLSNAYSIAIETDDNIGDTIDPDDTFEFRGIEYSVVAVKASRSCMNVNAREYVIVGQIGG
jgi:hypothetical protein